MTTTQSVAIGGIERELRRLWEEHAAEAGGEAVTRVLTLNLVARLADSASAEQAAAVVQELTATHPSRTVLAIVQPGAEPHLEAFVRASCRLAGPGLPQVCDEQVTIDARGVPSGQVASLILPLLLPDLPVALWLPGPAPFADPLLPRLRGTIDRLIVDSQQFADPARDLAAMAAFDGTDAAPGAHPPAVSDLSWAALTPWRELLAQFFDTRPLLPYLQRIDRVEIGYVPVPGRANPVPALLAAGWLASRLGWVPLENAVSVERTSLRLFLRRAAVGVGPNAIRLVQVDLRPVAAAPETPPGLASLRLQAVDGIPAQFSVERAEQPGFALTTAQVDDTTPVRRLARCETPSLAELLAAELRLLSRDRTFSAALKAAGVFAGHLG